MSGPARRDLVWDAALRALVSSPAAIRLHDVRELVEEDVSDRTVRRAMNAMLVLGWLEKEKDTGHYWQPGPKARQFLRVPTSDRALRIGEPDRDRRDGIEPVEELDELALNEIDDALDGLDIKGEGVLQERRRENVRDVLLYLRAKREASTEELKERFFTPEGLDYSTPHSWWKNLVYPALRDLEIAETGGEGSHKWFYVGPE